MKKIKLSEAQQDVLNKALDAILNIGVRKFVIGGVAGSGKSTLILELVRTLSDLGYRVAVAAPTGKAAMVLQKKGMLDAKTLHSMLYYPDIDPDTGKILGFIPRDTLECDILLADEGSMIGWSMDNDIKAYGIQVVYIGDRKQLPAIDNKHDFSAMGAPDVELTEIHRVAADNPIIQLSKAVRETGEFKKHLFTDVEEVNFVNKSEIKVRFLRELNPDVILCAYRATRDKMNSLSRVVRGFDSYTPEPGEIIMCEKNGFAKDTPIYNGERFEVLEANIHRTKNFGYKTYDKAGNVEWHSEVGHEYLIRSIDRGDEIISTVYIPNKCWDGCEPEYHGRDMGKFNFAYACTVHKSQGSEYDNVLFIDEGLPRTWDKPAFRYTAVTRAAKTITIAQ